VFDQELVKPPRHGQTYHLLMMYWHKSAILNEIIFLGQIPALTLSLDRTVDYVNIRMNGLSFHSTNVNGFFCFEWDAGQDLMIMESSSGLMARAHILSEFAEKLKLTTEGGVSYLHIKSTICPVNVVRSTQLWEITSCLLNWDGDSEKCVGIMVLEVLIDTMLLYGSLSPRIPAQASEQSGRASEGWDMRFDEHNRIFYFVKPGHGKCPVFASCYPPIISCL
jgi:hypothetical protein